MAFTVETGSIVAGANSYVDVSFADTYFSDRGNTEWAAFATAKKQNLLVKGTDYVDRNYRFLGQIIEDDQPLLFPREDIYGRISGRNYIGTIPLCLKQAVCELAIRASSQELNPDVTEAPVVSISEKVAVVEEKTSYMSTFFAPSFPQADTLMLDITCSGRMAERG